MSLENKLFKLIEKREYAAACTLLATNPIDINAVDEEGCSFFMAAVERSVGAPQVCHTFIEQVLSRPDFRQANKPVDGTSATPFYAALSRNNPSLIELILKYKDAKGIQVVFDEDKLWYERQAQKIQNTKEQMIKEPNSPVKSPLENQEQILAYLLAEAVYYAIKTDDVSIMQRLADAGAKLHHPLKNGTYPMDLVRNRPELKVQQWLSHYIKEQNASSSTYFLAVNNLERKHAEQQQRLVEKQTDATRAAIVGLFKFYDISDEELRRQPDSDHQLVKN